MRSRRGSDRGRVRSIFCMHEWCVVVWLCICLDATEYLDDSHRAFSQCKEDSTLNCLNVQDRVN